MGNFRLALAQLDPIVGDLTGNSALIKSAAQTALAASADLLVVPEMMLTGYPIEDLSLRPSFRAAVLVNLNELAAQLAELGAGELVIITGYLDADRNAAAVIHRGKVIAKYFKHHLPNYGVFDEHRYFTAGDQTLTIRVADVDVAIAICEDIWQDDGVISKIKQNNVGLLVVLNGSPYEQSKTDKRLQLVKTRAAEISAAVGYVNMVGGQDELVFDGASFVVSSTGELLARANLFTPELLITDLELPTATAIETIEISTTPSSHASAASIADPLEPLAELWQALVVGLR